MPSLRWSRHLALGWTGLILLVTLLPGPKITAPPEDLPSIFCLLCGERGGADGILNFYSSCPLGSLWWPPPVGQYAWWCSLGRFRL